MTQAVDVRTVIMRSQKSGPEVINIFSCSTQVSMIFSCSFMSRKDSVPGLSEPEKTEFLDIFLSL